MFPLMKRVDPGEPQHWLLLILVAKFPLSYPNSLFWKSDTSELALKRLKNANEDSNLTGQWRNMRQYLTSPVIVKYVKKTPNFCNCLSQVGRRVLSLWESVIPRLSEPGGARPAQQMEDVLQFPVHTTLSKL